MGFDSLRRNRVVVEIGGLPISLHSEDRAFREMLKHRYRGFLAPCCSPEFELDIELDEPTLKNDEPDDVEVYRRDGEWFLRRGDFSATWNIQSGQGRVTQSRNPYAIDSVLRILHTLILASRGGFLIHAASAIRNERAFLFAGVSGAGKTTISRLAPPGVTLLTDEISYVRKDDKYSACGTPFAGELAKPGENVSAPINAVFLLHKGPSHGIEPIAPADALRSLLRNVLFFSGDETLVKCVFESIYDFVSSVPVHRLTFAPEERVWELVA